MTLVNKMNHAKDLVWDLRSGNTHNTLAPEVPLPFVLASSLLSVSSWMLQMSFLACHVSDGTEIKTVPFLAVSV